MLFDAWYTFLLIASLQSRGLNFWLIIRLWNFMMKVSLYMCTNFEISDLPNSVTLLDIVSLVPRISCSSRSSYPENHSSISYFGSNQSGTSYFSGYGRCDVGRRRWRKAEIRHPIMCIIIHHVTTRVSRVMTRVHASWRKTSVKSSASAVLNVSLLIHIKFSLEKKRLYSKLICYL